MKNLGQEYDITYNIEGKGVASDVELLHELQALLSYGPLLSLDLVNVILKQILQLGKGVSSRVKGGMP